MLRSVPWILFFQLITSSELAAQSDCDVLHRLVRSAESGFTDIRGRRTDAGIYDATLILPGIRDASDCTVFSSPPSYSCSWSRFRTDAERLAQGHRVGNLVQACLAIEPRRGTIPESARYTFRMPDKPKVGRQIVIEVKANRGGTSLDFEIRVRE